MEKDTSCKTPRWRLLKSQLNNLTTEDFAKRIDSLSNAILIDVRTSKEYEFGHIPSAINMDYLSDNFLEKIEKLDRDKDYLIYCRSGRRSIRVCTWMRNMGFDNQRVFNLDLGFNDWLEHFPEAVIR